MKSLFLLTLSTLLLSSSCKKNNTNPVDQLPAETQTGANTFGCLVNGQVFIPGGAQLSGGSLSCNYQYLGSGVNGGYYFRLSATKGAGNNQTAVGLFTDSLKIVENLTLNLDSAFKGSSYGLYFGLGASQQDWIYTTKKPNFSGTLFIKKA